MNSCELELVVLSGASKGDRFKFQLSEQGVVIGRLAECELVLQDPLVSRKHAKILKKGYDVHLADLGSSHGTMHMGFRLEAGEEHSRKLSPGDEFKTGDSLFRVEFEQEDPPVQAVSGKKQSVSGSGFKIPPKKKLVLLGVTVLAAAVVIFLLTEDDSGQLPPQRSGEKVALPERSALGYLSESDRSHADKVQFLVPPSDGVIEYDFTGSDTTSIYLDGVKIETLPKTEGSWDQGMLLVRDPVGGRERVMAFDEESIKPNPDGTFSRLRRWGVRNARSTPLPYDESRSVDALLDGTLAFADQLGRSNDSLFRMSRVLQRAALGLLREIGLELQSVRIDLESPRVDPELVRLKLEGIINERKTPGISAEVITRQLKVIVELIGSMEAELWRKFTVDLKQALSDVKSKAYIQAHDRLLAVQTMIGDNDDYRWRKAEELLNDKKVIPPKVRKNPGRYRRDL